jgi:hypothetical protein
MKKILLSTLCIIVMLAIYWVVSEEAPSAAQSNVGRVNVDTKVTQPNKTPVETIDSSEMPKKEEFEIVIDEQGLVQLDPTPGMILDEDDPLLIYAKTEYAKTSMKRGIENYIVPYATSKPDNIYHSRSNIYRVMKDANGQWHLFPFNYTSAHMFSQAEQHKYLDNAPDACSGRNRSTISVQSDH